MYRRAFLIILVLASLGVLVLACLAGSARAAGYQPGISASEQLAGVVYHTNGTVSYGNAYGTLAAANPALTSPLSAVNLTLMNGTVVFIDRIDPGMDYSANYTVAKNDILYPLKLRETIVPMALGYGSLQQVRLVVDVENIGTADITGFLYQKTVPPGLAEAWSSYDGGILCVNDTVTWTLDSLAPGEKRHMSVAFNLTPSANATFPEAYVRYTYLASLTGNAPAFTGTTNTSFQVQKSHTSDGTWNVNASVPDNSEFVILLNTVTLSRADATDPFNTVTIASFTPHLALDPGCAWSTSLIDNFAPVPAYFIKMAYTMPYTLDMRSQVRAQTEAVVVNVPYPTPVPTSRPNNPYVTVYPTVPPSPSPPPAAMPDIVFVTPRDGDVIMDNTTDLETSVPPSDDPGYVVYYGSKNNRTWTKLGESPVSGNVSGLLWSVPELNGKYYLKAEHYNKWGLRGVAYTQVLIAHEILPVGLTTLLISGTDWLMLLLMLIALLLIVLIVIPYLPGRYAIYDSSALYAMSNGDRDWLSKLPRRTIRPDAAIFEIAGADRIRMRPLESVEDMRRLEREYGLKAYDAMALQLAKETRAILFTADPRIAEIAKKIGVRVKTTDKVLVAPEQ